jgi:hypothetical protein
MISVFGLEGLRLMLNCMTVLCRFVVSDLVHERTWMLALFRVTDRPNTEELSLTVTKRKRPIWKEKLLSTATTIDQKAYRLCVFTGQQRREHCCSCTVPQKHIEGSQSSQKTRTTSCKTLCLLFWMQTPRELKRQKRMTEDAEYWIYHEKQGMSRNVMHTTNL